MLDSGKYILVLIIALVMVPARGYATQADTSSAEESGVGSLDFAFFPVFSYSLETRFVLGGMLYSTIVTADTTERQRPSMFMPSIMYSQNKQLTLQVQFDHYWNQATRRLFGSVIFRKFPNRFYGIGNDLPDEYETYTPRIVIADVNYQRGIIRDINIGGGFRFENMEIVEVESGGLLDAGGVLGADGGLVSGLSLLATWDSRDHNNYPMEGVYFDLRLKQFDRLLGSDFSFSALELDARTYVTLPASQVLAFQLQLRDISGEAPFQYLSTLGGDRSMRGYYDGRYRQNDQAIAQAEYRLSSPRKFGLVLFVCAGEVNRTLGNMALADFKYSYGFGIRWLMIPESKSNLRVDFGYGKGTSGVMVGLSEAF